MKKIIWEFSIGSCGAYTFQGHKPFIMSILIFQLLISISQAQVLSDSFQVVDDPTINELDLGNANHTLIDENGGMWISTKNGVFTFNGTTLQQVDIRNDEGLSLSSLSVKKVIRNQADEDWFFICTDAYGLIEYNESTENTITHIHESNDPFSPKGNNIISLIQEDSGNFWISTDNFTLSYYDRSKGQFFNYSPLDTSKAQEAGILGEMVQCPIQENILWLGSRFGLYQFDKRLKQFRLFPFEKSYEKYLSHQYIRMFADKQEGLLWVGRFNEGLWRYNPLSGQALSDGIISANRAFTARNVVLDILPYSDNTLIVSSEREGLAEFDRCNGALLGTYNLATGLPAESLTINSIRYDQQKYLWLSTRNGLSRLIKRQNNTRVIDHETWLRSFYHSIGKEPFRRQRNWLRADLFSNDGKYLYLGTQNGNGLIKYDLPNDSFSLIFDEKNFLGIEHNQWLDALCEDEQERIWIGTDQGLYLCKDGVPYFTKVLVGNELIDNQHISTIVCHGQQLYLGTLGEGVFRLDLRSIETGEGVLIEAVEQIGRKEIYKLYFDNSGMLWVGANPGVLVFDPQRKRILPYEKHQGGGSWLTNLKIYDVAETQNKVIYLTTLGDGLVSYDQKNRSWRSYRSSKYAQNFMGELVIAPNQNIIISSIGEYLEFNSALTYDHFPALENYRTSLGVERSLIAFPDGRIWGGEDQGIVEFKIFNNASSLVPLYIKEFAVNGELKYNTAQLKRIASLTLSYDENTFSIVPDAINFAVNAENHFLQKLEGVDRDWIGIKSNNSVTYSHVAPGTYQYLYQARDQFGKTSKEIATLDIIVLPPWWRSKIAYLTYFLLTMATLFLARQQIIQREKLKNRLRLEQIEKEKVQELDQLRAQFFANISHEFRTPLTLIKAPLETLLAENKNKEDQITFFRLHQNTERLLHLVDQLLDLSKLEAGMLKLEVESVEAFSLLRQLAGNFQSLAQQKQLEFKLEIPKQASSLSLDKDKLEKIVFNLLSNAFKFAPKQGWVVFEVEYDKALKIRVGNSGTPIPANEQQKIFNRFYQAGDTRHQGAGIGLALVRELVKLHNGNIRVVSAEKEGTWFHVELPLEFAKANVWEKEPNNTLESSPKEITNTLIEDKSVPSVASLLKQQPTVLLVEDHEEVRAFIKAQLTHLYKIIEAENGAVGWQQTLQQTPSLIISDVMMPVMDGVIFCDKVKTDPRTDHIPIILLTAKADVESRIKGLQTGADDYLAKPFNSEELKVRCANLIKQRQKLQQRYQQSLFLPKGKKGISNAEVAFIKEAIRVVETNLSNAEFSAENFASAMHLSRTHLYRKLKATTGMSITDFMRNLRLEKAHLLLSESADNISEIAYQVGFNNLSYFARCFREKYNCSPSEFAKG